jgi:hypothetical protein
MSRIRFDLAPATRVNGEGEFDLLTEPTEDRHEPVDSEAAKVDVSDADKLAMGDPCPGTGLPRRQFFGIEDFDQVDFMFRRLDPDL